MLRTIGEISDNLLGGIVGRINYLLIDETDQADDLECEGEILERYFSSSRRVNDKRSVSHIHRKSDYLSKLKKGRANKFNIVHLAAHGEYQQKTEGSAGSFGCLPEEGLGRQGGVLSGRHRQDRTLRRCFCVHLLPDLQRSFFGGAEGIW